MRIHFFVFGLVIGTLAIVCLLGSIRSDPSVFHEAIIMKIKVRLTVEHNNELGQTRITER